MEPFPLPTRWNLDELITEPVKESIQQQLALAEEKVAALEAVRSDLTPDLPEEKFVRLLKLLESVNAITGRLQAFSYLWLSEDTQNEAALNLRDSLDQSLVTLGNRILFFDIWFKELPDASASRLIAAAGDLKYFLESIRRFKPHTLGEREEQLLALKDPNGIDALVGLYEMITNKFTFSLEVDGKQQTLTRDQLSSYYFHASPDVRQAAYQELYRVYAENSTVLAQIYSHRVRDWQVEGLQMRHYASPIAARNLGNDLPDEVVDTLLAVCRRNASLFHPYFQYKARKLGLEKLRRYDIYAPLEKAEKTYDFQTAASLVLDTFKDFSPTMHGCARRVFDEKHIDAEIRPGKRGGGFCLGVLPTITPWVLVNFNGKPGDVATLAHELGHAVHSMLASSHSVLSFHPPQPLAETASVFAEMQLTERLIQQEQEASVRRDLLVRLIDDAYATVIRQAYISVFEKDAHRMLVEGSSFEELSSHYFSLLQEQFGDAMQLTDEFRWEWITIPHIYDAPFYTYSYCFGQLLVLALVQQYRLHGEAFIPGYLKILSYGGSENPMKILKEAGMDVSSEAFWQGGFELLATLIKELTQQN